MIAKQSWLMKVSPDSPLYRHDIGGKQITHVNKGKNYKAIKQKKLQEKDSVTYNIIGESKNVSG